MSDFCELPFVNLKKTESKVIWKNVKIDVQGICLFRILLPILLLYDLFFNILPFWDVLYGEHSLIHLGEYPIIVPWSFFQMTDNTFIQITLIAVYVISLLALMVGFKPNLFCVIAFFIYFALNERNPYIMSNAEVLSRNLLLWMCFLPLERYWSVSGAIRGDQEKVSTWPIIPALAIKLQILVIYFESGLWKLASNDWYSGKAIEQVSMDQFYANTFGNYFINLFSANILFFLTWSVIIFQITFSILVYFPYKNNFFRAVALVCTFLMHISFIFFLHIYWFPYFCLSYLVILFPDRWFDAFFKKRREWLKKISIFYDPDCGFCRSTALIFNEFCLGGVAKVMPASMDQKAKELLEKYTSWVVFTHDGQIYMKWRAVSYILKCSPVFWIFGWLSGLQVLSRWTENIYDLIGRNRHILSCRFRMFLLPKPEFFPNCIMQAICGFCLVIMLSFSMLSLPQSPIKPGQNLAILAYFTGTAQVWSLFAPEVHKHQYHFSFTAQDKEGHQIDLQSIMGKQYHVEENGFITFPNTKFLKYYTFMFSNSSLRDHMAHYLCDVTRDNPVSAQIVHIQMQRSSYIKNEPPLKFDTEYQCSDFGF